MLTPDQIETIEEQNEIAEVLRWEEEMQAKRILLPPMPVDGEETEEGRIEDGQEDIAEEEGESTSAV